MIRGGLVAQRADCHAEAQKHGEHHSGIDHSSDAVLAPWSLYAQPRPLRGALAKNVD